VSTKAVMDTTGSGRRRNRSWPEALKREIVAASLAARRVGFGGRPGATMLNANQVSVGVSCIATVR